MTRTSTIKLRHSYSPCRSTDAVVKEAQKGKSNIGMAGVYVTDDKLAKVDMSYYHSSDCAAFVSLTSTALPRFIVTPNFAQWTFATLQVSSNNGALSLDCMVSTDISLHFRHFPYRIFGQAHPVTLAENSWRSGEHVLVCLRNIYKLFHVLRERFME